MAGFDRRASQLWDDNLIFCPPTNSSGNQASLDVVRNDTSRPKRCVIDCGLRLPFIAGSSHPYRITMFRALPIRPGLPDTGGGLP
jgi:hypothetical protein